MVLKLLAARAPTLYGWLGVIQDDEEPKKCRGVEGKE